jgi:hypothetical protein
MTVDRYKLRGDHDGYHYMERNIDGEYVEYDDYLELEKRNKTNEHFRVEYLDKAFKAEAENNQLKWEKQIFLDILYDIRNHWSPGVNAKVRIADIEDILTHNNREVE